MMCTACKYDDQTWQHRNICGAPSQRPPKKAPAPSRQAKKPPPVKRSSTRRQ